jgi:hypothetical protein
MKRNTEIGLPALPPEWPRPKTKVQARESPPSEVYSTVTAASAA